MEIKLDAEAAASIASAAIFESLSQDARDNVLKQAVQALLTPEKGSYGSIGATPLQQAFDTAIRQAAYGAVREKIQSDPEIATKIQELMGPLLNAAMDGEAENWNTSLADALGAALGTWLGEVARDRSIR